MKPRRRTVLRLIAPLAALPLAVGPAGTTAAPAAPQDHQRAVSTGVIFDDFRYRSSSDVALTRHGWRVRRGDGAPGVERGATWKPSNVSFPKIDGVRVLQLQLTTDGTAAGTTESEFSRKTSNSLAGTYLSRIKFANAPARGRDGDHLVQSFFAIASTRACDPTYSETDFSEYLPNGGYGSSGSLNSQTTWHSDGWHCIDNVSINEKVSLAGWHTVMSTVANGHVKYFIDGKLVADHAGRYYPRRPMAIDFNLWLIDLTGHQGSRTSVWHEDVDYVYYAKNRVLSLSQAEGQVASLRRHDVGYRDTV